MTTTAIRCMILISSSEAAEAAIEGEAQQEFAAAHTGLIAELTASGELVETHELSLADAKVVRTHGGLTIAEGPNACGGQWVGGYYLVDVAHEARALEIAARFVEARYAPVEVRRVV